MIYAPKVVLHCVNGYSIALNAMVEQFISDGVKFVAVAGTDCARVEDIIDDLVIGDGSDTSRFICTSSHPGESLGDVVEFARSCILDPSGDPQLVEL